MIVTTPQEVAVGDALRGAKMFEKVGVPVVGVVENMSAFTDPETGKRFELFSVGRRPAPGRRDRRAAAGLGAAAAGARRGGGCRPAGAGGAPGSPAATVLRDIAAKVQEAVAARPMALPILNG